jgi:hypothetical protein
VARRGRRRSGGWQAVVLSACLAMASYGSFDAFDLDGSAFREPDVSSKIAAEPSQDDAKRAPATRLSPFESPPVVPSLPIPRSVQEALRSLPRWPLASSAPLLGHLRPRAHVAREARGTPSAPAEPA